MSGISTRAPITLGAAALLALTLAACDGLGLGGEPENLRVEIDAATNTEIVLVTSTQFRFEEDPGCDPEDPSPCPEILRVLSADSTTITPPVTRNLPFTGTLQYFVEVFPANTATAVTLRAFVDGEPWSNETRELALPVNPEDDRETIQFVYRYSEPRLQ